MTHIIVNETESETQYWTGKYFNPNPRLALVMSLSAAQQDLTVLRNQQRLQDPADRIEPYIDHAGRIQ